MTPEDVQHELDMHERHGHGSIRCDVDRLTSRVDELVGIVDDQRRAIEAWGNQLRGYVDGSIAEHVEAAPHRYADGSTA